MTCFGSCAGSRCGCGALVSMVCNLTIGKPKYLPVEADMRALLAKAESLRQRLLDAMADDVRVFDAVMAAYGMPRDDDAQKAARSAAIQRALCDATDVPLDCARLSAEVIGLCRETAEKGNVNVVSLSLIHI